MGIIDQSNSNGQPSLNWAIILFQTPIYCPLNSLIIGSHFDTDIQLNTCRLALSGRIIQNFDEKQDTSRIRIYTKKEKTAIVTRLGDAYCRKSDQKTIRFEVYGSDLFKKETNMSPFMGMILHTDDPNEVGYIHSSFGTAGKFKAYFPSGTLCKKGDSLYLRFKRFINDYKKHMHQDPYKFPSQIQATKLEVVTNKEKKKKSSKAVGNGEITNFKKA